MRSRAFPWLSARFRRSLPALQPRRLRVREPSPSPWEAPPQSSLIGARGPQVRGKTGIRVELLRQPTIPACGGQGLTVPLQARISSPDVFLMAWHGLPSSPPPGGLSLSPRTSERRGAAGKEAFFLRMIDTVDTYEGGVVALPVYVDGGLLYYRKDLLGKYGLPGPPGPGTSFSGIRKPSSGASAGPGPGFTPLRGRGPSMRDWYATSWSSRARREGSAWKTAR